MISLVDHIRKLEARVKVLEFINKTLKEAILEYEQELTRCYENEVK